MICVAKTQDFLHDSLRSILRIVVREEPGTYEAGPTLSRVLLAPSIKARTTNLKVSAGLANIGDLVGMLQNTQLASKFAVISGH
jgi:hypothetical protein